MKRTIDQWRNCEPRAMANNQSNAAVQFALEDAKADVALSGVAQTGLASRCKVDTENPEIALSGVIEIIPCSQAAEESIRGY